MRESSLRWWLRDHSDPAHKYYPVENKIYPGMADYWVCFPKRMTFWLELKAIRSPKSKIKFEDGQPEFLETVTKDGYAAYILVLCGHNLLFLYDGKEAMNMKIGKTVQPLKEFTFVRPSEGVQDFEDFLIHHERSNAN